MIYSQLGRVWSFSDNFEIQIKEDERVKKIIAILIIVLAIIGLVACEEERFERIEYSNGDRIVRNGIIFEYFDIREDWNKFSERVFSFDSDDSYSIHSHYYFDMTDRNQDRIIPFAPIGNTQPTEMLRKAYALGSANVDGTLGGWYFSLGCLTGMSATSGLTWFDGSSTLDFTGFIVVGKANENLRDIVIPGVIDGNFVFAIGFGAFRDTNITSFRWEDRDNGWASGRPPTLVLPYAFDNTPNLVSVQLPTWIGLNIILSKGFSNSGVRVIENVSILMDASFYNLTSLETVTLLNTVRHSHMIGGLFTYNGKIIRTELRFMAGFRRSSFYKTPNLINIVNQNVFYQNGVFYMIAGTGIDNETIISPIFFKDGFQLNVDIISWLNTARLNDDGTFTLASFNLGREVRGKLYSIKNKHVLCENGHINLHWGSVRNNISLVWEN